MLSYILVKTVKTKEIHTNETTNQCRRWKSFNNHSDWFYSLFLSALPNINSAVCLNDEKRWNTDECADLDHQLQLFFLPANRQQSQLFFPSSWMCGWAWSRYLSRVRMQRKRQFSIKGYLVTFILLLPSGNVDLKYVNVNCASRSFIYFLS